MVETQPGYASIYCKRKGADSEETIVFCADLDVRFDIEPVAKGR